MIPPKPWRAIVFATNVAWFCGALPVRFVKDKAGHHVIQVYLTKWRSLYFRASLSLNCFYVCFIAFRIFQKVVLEKEETSLDFLVQMGYLTLCYTMTAVLQINTLITWEETPRFLQRYLGYFRNIKETYMLAGEKGPKCIKFFTAVIIIGILVNLQNAVFIMKKPDRLHFLTSVFKDPLKTPIIARLPVLIIHGWIWISTWAHVWAFGMHMYAYTSCMVFTIKELDWKVKQARTKSALREPKTFVRTFRSMQVLHRLWQQTYQDWFCPSHKAVAISVGSLASYGVIKLSGPRSLVMGCLVMLSLLYLWNLFRKFGQMYELSQLVLENWMYCPTSSRWLRRFLRSVPIFKIDIGSFYVVKKTTVVSVLWTVLNNTITLLFL